MIYTHKEKQKKKNEREREKKKMETAIRKCYIIILFVSAIFILSKKTPEGHKVLSELYNNYDLSNLN